MIQIPTEKQFMIPGRKLSISEMYIRFSNQKTYTVESNNLANDPNGLITRIYVYDNAITNGVKNVVVLANYTTAAQSGSVFPLCRAMAESNG
jgi:hypothetical protein